MDRHRQVMLQKAEEWAEENVIESLKPMIKTMIQSCQEGSMFNPQVSFLTLWVALRFSGAMPFYGFMNYLSRSFNSTNFMD